MDYINDREGIMRQLKKQLKGEKFRHSINVEKTAIEMAKHYGADTAKAGLAGLLHDYTKQMDNGALAAEFGITGKAPKTLHGHTAAALLKQEGLVDDEEVLSAIMWHTTGKANMTLLDKIIYLADYIEPLRDFSGVKRLRTLSFQEIDKAVFLGLKMTLRVVLESGTTIDLDSVSAYNFYLKKYEGDKI